VVERPDDREAALQEASGGGPPVLQDLGCRDPRPARVTVRIDVEVGEEDELGVRERKDVQLEQRLPEHPLGALDLVAIGSDVLGHRAARLVVGKDVVGVAVLVRRRYRAGPRSRCGGAVATRDDDDRLVLCPREQRSHSHGT